MIVQLGWEAPKISEQFPELSKETEEHFQRDREDLLRLKLRGLITPTEYKKALYRFQKNISAELSKGKKD